LKAWQKAAGGAVALITAATVTFVTQWEGTEYTPYRDIVGVLTVCQGITGKDVVEGKTYSKGECDALLMRELQHHANGFLACINVPLNANETTAYASWTFNVGINAACKSTLAQKLNANDRAGACLELLKWNRAGGKPVQGLTNRRQAEYKLCVTP